MDYLNLDKHSTKLVAKELNVLLANYHFYYQNLKNFHWNVKGQFFFELHRQFEVLFTGAMADIDTIAERILALREYPASRYSAYLELSSIKEAGTNLQDTQMVNHVLKDHKILIKSMRHILSEAGEVKDEGTIDLIASMLEKIEKESWMLDAWRSKVLEMVNA